MDVKNLKIKMEALRNSKGGSIGLRSTKGKVSDQRFSRIEKLKLEENSGVKALVPISFESSFDPFDPKNGMYDSENKFSKPVAMSTIIKMIKLEMQDRPDLKAFYTERLGIKPEDYVIDLENITKQDWEIFGSFRTPLRYTSNAMSSKFASDGKFGSTFAIDLEFDDNGQISKGDMCYDLSLLEGAIAAVKSEEIKKKYELGELTGSDEERRNAIKAPYKTMLLSRPKLVGVIPLIAIKIDPQSGTITDNMDDVVKNIDKYVSYTSGCDSVYNGQIKNIIGKVTDIYMDFIEVDIKLGSLKDVKREEKDLKAFTLRNYLDNPYVRVKDTPQFGALEEAFAKMIDDNEVMSELAFANSVFAFRPVPPATILAKYSEEFSFREKYITESIFKQFRNTIKEISPEIYASLTSSLLDDKLDKTAITVEHNNVLDKSVVEDPDGIPTNIPELDELDKTVNVG